MQRRSTCAFQRVNDRAFQRFLIMRISLLGQAASSSTPSGKHAVANRKAADVIVRAKTEGGTPGGVEADDRTPVRA